MKKYIIIVLISFLVGGYSFANSDWSFLKQKAISLKQDFDIRQLDTEEKELLTKDGPYLGDLSGDNLYLVTTTLQINGVVVQFVVNLYPFDRGIMHRGYLLKTRDDKFYLKYWDNQKNKWIVLDSYIQFFGKIYKYEPIGVSNTIESDIAEKFIGLSKYCYLSTGSNSNVIQIKSHVPVDNINQGDECNTKYITTFQQGFRGLGEDSYYFENSNNKWFGLISSPNIGFSGPGIYLKKTKEINGLIVNWIQGNKYDDIVYSDELSGYRKGDVISFGIGSGSTNWYQIRWFKNKNSVIKLRKELGLNGCILKLDSVLRSAPNNFFQKEIDSARSKKSSGLQLTDRENEIVGSMGPFVCPYITGGFSELGSGLIWYQNLKQRGGFVGQYIESIELK